MRRQILFGLCALSLVCCVPPVKPPEDLGIPADLPPGPIDLGNADLGNADLGGADLGGADLGSADLGGADLAPPVTGVCDPAGPCWENPLPDGNPIIDVWGPAAGDVWAVGGAGTIRHWNGTAWSQVLSPTRQTLRGVWASSASDAWAVGRGGVILRWNGTAWSQVASGTTESLAGVWGSRKDDVWAVAGQSQNPDPFTRTHTFLHWDGTRWTITKVTAPESSNTTIARMAGCSASEIYAVGTHGKAVWFVYDGTRWTGVPKGSSSSSYAGVWCSGPGKAPFLTLNQCPMGICSTVVSGEGASWSRMGYSTGPITGSGPSDVWTFASNLSAGPPAYTLHWDGTRWEELDGSLRAPRFIDKPGSHFTWTGASADVQHRDRVMDPWVSSVSGPSAGLRGVWGTAADRLWAVGEGGTILSRGSAAPFWSAMTAPTTRTLRAVWGSGPTQMWAVGSEGTLLSGNGTRWVALASGTTAELLAIAGSGPSDAWIAGTGRLLRWDGAGWSTFSTTIGGTALSVLGPADAWLVSDTVVRRFDGTQWNTVAVGVSDSFRGVWASGPSDVWLVGSKDFVRFDGTSFKTVPSGADSLAGPIWASGPSDVWARGVKDGLEVNLRWDGTAWRAQTSETTQTLQGLFGVKGVGVWGVGTGGAIIRYAP